MINLKIIVKIDSSKQSEFEQAMREMLISEESGYNNHPAEISRDLHEPNLYIFQQEWPSKKSMEKHFSSDEFHSLLGAMKVLGEIVDTRILYSEKEEKLNSKNLVN